MKPAIGIERTRRREDMRTCARFMAASEPWLTLGRDYAGCLKSVTAPLREIYAAREKGEALGFIILEMTGTFKGYIKTICVAPGARGRGIGTLLIKYAEKRIFGETRNVFMCVSSFNNGARKLYERLGYKKTGALKDFVVRGHDEIILRKTRGPLRH
jgi:ribosomal protein S18 acetylase RimI-like enzyme